MMEYQEFGQLWALSTEDQSYLKLILFSEAHQCEDEDMLLPNDLGSASACLLSCLISGQVSLQNRLEYHHDTMNITY